MSINHDRIVTRPGEVVGATSPGRSETREGYDSTDTAEAASFLTRRRFVLGAAGAGLLFLTGGGAYLATRSGGDTTEETNPNVNQNGPETGPVFEKNLALNHMVRPETLDAPTFDGVIENMGLAIQYAVNNGDTELLRRLIPGGQAGVLQPGQFELRAAFIKGYRGSSRGTMNDDPNNPNDTRYYPWGFTMTLVEQLSHVGSDPQAAETTKLLAKVRVTMGDVPPLVTMQTVENTVEPQKTFEVDIELTRFARYEDGRFVELPDIDGTTGRGWGLANMSQMYPVPTFMTGAHLPDSFTEVPPLYQKS